MLRGGPWTHNEQHEILNYCQSDVEPLPPLLVAMLPSIMATPKTRPTAAEGRYTAAVARMERCGIPIDAETLVAIQDGWEDIKTQLIDEVDSQYGVFDHGHFRDG